MKVSKNDLIRSAVAAKLAEWKEDNSDKVFKRDLTSGHWIR